MKPSWISLVIILYIFAVDAFADTIKGHVIAVLDGDTIEVLHGKHAERIRLYGIDCPEKRQPYGKRAKQVTSSLLYGKDVSVESYGVDKYGRTLGDVMLPDGLIVNRELVKRGWCWWYRKYAPNDTELELFEREAKEARRGLWSDPDPIPPWEYRKIGRRNPAIPLK